VYYLPVTAFSADAHDLEKLDPNSNQSVVVIPLIDKRMACLNVSMYSTDPYLFYPILYNTYPFIRPVSKEPFISRNFEKSH